MTDISKKPTTVQSENNSRKLNDSTNSNPKANIKNKDSQDSQVSLFFTKPEEEPLLNNIDGEMKVWIDDLMDLYNSSHLDPTESTFSQKTSTPVTLEQEQPTSHSNTPNTYSKRTPRPTKNQDKPSCYEITSSASPDTTQSLLGKCKTTISAQKDPNLTTTRARRQDITIDNSAIETTDLTDVVTTRSGKRSISKRSTPKKSNKKPKKN